MRGRLLISLIYVIIVTATMPLLGQDDRAADMFSRAEAYYENRELQNARTLYWQYINLFPNGEALDQATFRYAECIAEDRSLTQRTRLTRAINELEAAVAKFPFSLFAPRAMYITAQCYITLGFQQDAIIALRQARENYPDGMLADRILLLLADTYFDVGEFQQATTYFDAFIQTYPEHLEITSILTRQATAYHQSKDFARTLATIEHLESLAPDMVSASNDLLFQKAESQLYTGQLTTARTLFEQIQDADPDPALAIHIAVRLGEICFREGNMADSAEARQRKFREGTDIYVDAYLICQDPRVQESLAMLVVESAGTARLDITEVYQLPPPEELLAQVYDRALDPNHRTLVLLRMARYNRENGKLYLALEQYRSATQDFAGAELARHVGGEYRQFIRLLMDAAWQADDYSHFLDFFVGFGSALELSEEEVLRLAVCYSRVGLYDEATPLFAELRSRGISAEEQKIIAVELMEIALSQKDYEAVYTEMETILGLNPSLRERERLINAQLDIYFNERDLQGLQTYYLENKEEMETEFLSFSAWYKLAALYYLDGNRDEAAVYLDQFFRDYGGATITDSQRYDVNIIMSAMLTYADIYYERGDYATANGLYERYLYLYTPIADLSWALYQSGRCRMALGQNELARDLLGQFVTRYPDHYMKAHAERLILQLSPQQ